MINVSDYIKIILQKKKWTRSKLLKEINKIEEQLGDARTTKQNISNYLNGSHDIRPKWLVKVEKALNLPFGTLVSMVSSPTTKEGKKELNEIIRKVRELK